MRRNRNVKLEFWVTEDERSMIEEKMAQYGTENMSAYLRKISIDGYVIRLELPELKDSCLGVNIREDRLLPVLLDIMQAQMETTLGSYALMLADDNHREKERQTILSALAEHRRTIEQCRSKGRGLYESLVQGVISNEEYFSFKSRYEVKASDAEKEVSRLKHSIKLMELQKKREESLSHDLSDIRKKPELTATLIDRLIERIEVSHDKQISVSFRFQSEFAEYSEVNKR